MMANRIRTKQQAKQPLLQPAQPTDNRLTPEEAQAAQVTISHIIDNIELVMIGKRKAAELTLLALIAGGHLLIEDVPGVGKTSLVSALAKSVSCGFNRIQFTPDIMPSDVTGFSMYNRKTDTFEFRPGAAMNQFVLADEINRAPAKTQASLLEIMEERQVTVDATTYSMPEPFMVLATQNPANSIGTYPLPEAQLDRFLMRISIGYPDLNQELRILTETRQAKENCRPVASAEDILLLQKTSRRVFAAGSVQRYIVQVVHATRCHHDLSLGCSPRASLALYGLCQARALLYGREYVLPDDVKYLAPFVLAHRITLSHDAKIAKKSGADIIRSILQSIILPQEEKMP